MKRGFTLIMTAVLLCMTVFMAIGYAALSDNLSVTGTVEVEGKPYKGVYITKVEFVGSSYASCSENTFELPTNHITTADASRGGGSVTYRITVFNNTDVTYWYIGPRMTTSYGQNSLVGSGNGITITTKDHQNDNYQSFNTEDWIPPQTSREFYVTYSYGSSAQNACSTMINFYFDIRMDAVHDEFLAVLNNVKAPNSYEQLKGLMEQVYASTGQTTITTESHPDFFASMFEDLYVNIDGVERKASIVIRRENMDNDTTTGDDYNGGKKNGCEYTLYITVEPLTPGTRPTVYAIAYSEGAAKMGDDWYQVGELYEGTAPINKDGTINYSEWIATFKTYEMADGITYNVGQVGGGDQYDIMNKMEQLISAEDQDIFNMIDNVNIFKKVYDILQKHQGSSDPAVEGLRAAFYEAEKFYVNHNNGQEFKVVRNTYTRAEIIYAIKKIQSALDYYYQAYGG